VAVGGHGDSNGPCPVMKTQHHMDADTGGNASRKVIRRKQDGRIGFSQNETFMDVANDLTIHVESTDAHSATITLQPHYTVPSKGGKH
jgi:hypothetical protein